MYDVVVVGGGPAGCYAASLLGQRGLDVHVVEKHSVIGEPVDCSGVIGAEAFATLGLPSHLKLGHIRDLTLVSPSRLQVNFSPLTPLAYVVDRAAFDRVIADKTTQSGATIHTGCRVVDLRVLNDCVELDVKEVANDLIRLRARMAILAAVTKKARFDWHKDIVRFTLHHPELGKIFLRGIFR